MEKVILASNNMGKIKEFREILKDMDIELVSMKEAGIDVDIEEYGRTFSENALIKARTISEMTGCVTLADDSGLEVDWLNKEPGVHSARFMGHDTPYEIKNQAIIDKLKGVIGVFSRLLSPLFTKLFPEIPKGHPVTGSIFMNLAANMLGLDNAATPLGLKAMEGLQELNPKKDTASNPMIMFLVLNTSVLLIPLISSQWLS